MSALEYLQDRLHRININDSRTIWNLNDRAMVSDICIAFQGQSERIKELEAENASYRAFVFRMDKSSATLLAKVRELEKQLTFLKEGKK